MILIIIHVVRGGCLAVVDECDGFTGNFFSPDENPPKRNRPSRGVVVLGLAVVVARSYHVVLRPVCVRVWPRKSCVATGGGGVDSRSRFPNPRIMVCPPHPAKGPPPPTDHRCPPTFITHLSVFILIYMCSNGG